MSELNPAETTQQVESQESIINEKHRDARLQRERIWNFESTATVNRLLQGGELAKIKVDFEAIQNTEDWLESVYGFSKFSDYVVSPRDQKGLALQVDTVRKRIKVYNKFIDELSMEPEDERLTKVPWSALDIICHVVDEDNVDEWLDYAKTMSRDDLKSEIGKWERENMKQAGEEGKEEKSDTEPTNLAELIKTLPAKNAKRILESVVININDKIPNMEDADRSAYEGVLKMIEDYIDLD